MDIQDIEIGMKVKSSINFYYTYEVIKINDDETVDVCVVGVSREIIHKKICVDVLSAAAADN